MAKDIFDGYATRRHTFDGADLTVGVNGKSLMIVLHAVTKEFVLKGLVVMPRVVIEKSMVRGSQISMPIYPVSATPIYMSVRCPQNILNQGVEFVYDFVDAANEDILLEGGGTLTMSVAPKDGHDMYWETDPANRDDRPPLGDE